MGLVVDLRAKMTSMSPSHPSIGGGRSHIVINNNYNQHNQHQHQHQHNQVEQVARKKRTFDIAFLTGQSEQKVISSSSSAVSSLVVSNVITESNNNNNNENPSRNKRYSSPSSISYLASLPSEDGTEGSPFNLTQDGTNYSSDTSSMIDVMTNGSLSESESSPASSPRIVRTPTHPVIRSGNKGKGSSSNNTRNPGRISSTRNPVKEEIRFESKRTIDINHTSDSLKIKENLRFSTSIPSVSPGSIPSSDGSNGDLILPQMTFALFPHMAKFPMSIPMGLSQNNHLANDMGSSGMSFAASKMMEKCEGINLSYHHNPHHNNNHSLAISKLRGGFPDPYAHAAATASVSAAMAGGYPYPNLIIPHEMQHRHPQFSPGHGSSCGGNGSGGQPSPPGMNHPSGGVTLLPPSLTALTLPAQNVCAKCNIGFRMTSDLVYHMRSHHKRDTFDPLKKQREEKLKCPVCHETFRERHHLTRHMTAHQDRAEEKIEGAAIAAAAAAVCVAGTSIIGKK